MKLTRTKDGVKCIMGYALLVWLLISPLCFALMDNSIGFIATFWTMKPWIKSLMVFGYISMGLTAFIWLLSIPDR